MTPPSSHWLTSFKSKSKYLKIVNSTCLNNTVLFNLFKLFVSLKKKLPDICVFCCSEEEAEELRQLKENPRGESSSAANLKI